ncbi:MAG: hypothetical protein ACRDQ7_03755 [Haloechinothrix sp.]
MQRGVGVGDRFTAFDEIIPTSPESGVTSHPVVVMPFVSSRIGPPSQRYPASWAAEEPGPR